jgi:hypothetical protein
MEEMAMSSQRAKIAVLPAQLVDLETDRVTSPTSVDKTNRAHVPAALHMIFR